MGAPMLTFLGGAGTVTGSKTLVEVGSSRVLVDCGLYQGRKQLRERNWESLPVDPADIDAVLLTHAHIDHCGYLPRLVRFGFAGDVHCTDGTEMLARIVLPDSGRLHEEEAEYANKVGYSKHHPALPLYTEQDAKDSLGQLSAKGFRRQVEVVPGLRASWQRAGHILGAASVRLELDHYETSVVFSGDLGRPTHPILLPPDPIGRADFVVVESTYGDEDHAAADPDDVLADVISESAARGGVVIIPAFAVDRTEVVLWHIDRLVAHGRIPRLPVYVDSPMALRALDVYRSEVRAGSEEVRPELAGSELFTSIDVRQTRTTDESKALNSMHGPMIIVSASGMATGGRVIHHLANRLGDDRNAVVLVGFQAPGTRGEALRSGASKLKMFGRYFPVRARVAAVDLSAHADRSELLDWLATASAPPQMVLVNHGEPEASQALVDAIESELDFNAVVARPGERIRID